ncbi:hypothetical protein A8F94_21495 [Bacillus sp. FJAT-27225]|nr:hypothetical protein A8F94_21495 [Bacillus sp. FJAT-27225]
MTNVLVVDDEKTIRKGIKKLLEEVITGYNVLWEASNGSEALEILNIEVPDIIITDIRMPNMNGIDFIRCSKEKFPLTPIIVLSGYDDFIYVRDALKLGVKDYLLKPISRSDLANILLSIDHSNKENQMSIQVGESAYIRQIKDLIEKNLNADLTLQFISQTLNLHPNYISQLFSQETKIRLSEYITQRRIEKSKELLIKTNLKIIDISQLVGYAHSKNFATVFKKVVGTTPQRFRKI